MFFLFFHASICGLAVNTYNSRSGSPGFKPCPSYCFLRQGTLLHFVSGGAKVQVTGHRSGYRSDHRPQVRSQVRSQVTHKNNRKLDKTVLD